MNEDSFEPKIMRIIFKYNKQNKANNIPILSNTLKQINPKVE